MSEEHTPGPWSRRDTETHAEIDAPGHTTLAMVAKGEDANLIAAAPELLKELTDLVDWLHDNQRSIEGEFLMDDLLASSRAVIAKATGAA